MEKPFKIINVPRLFAATDHLIDDLEKMDDREWAWIYIHEPDDIYNNSKYQFGDKIKSFPTLEVKFWDITKRTSIQLIGDNGVQDYIMDVISDWDAMRIAVFLEAYPNHNIIVSCLAGKCRSGAVCQFAEKYCNKEWVEKFKSKADPNSLVYEKLVNSWRVI